jgi:probable HAF family extracellular repeat protein
MNFEAKYSLPSLGNGVEPAELGFVLMQLKEKQFHFRFLQGDIAPLNAVNSRRQIPASVEIERKQNEDPSSSRFSIRRSVNITISLLALLTVAGPSVLVGGIRYSVTDLGTLGGDWSSADGINNAGQVVGGAYTASGIIHAFLYSGGSMIDLGTLGGDYSCASGINDNGQVVGEASIASGDLYDYAFLYSGGSMIDLGTFGGGGSMACGINKNGQVVGMAATSAAQNLNHAFLYSGGSMIDLGTLGGDYSFASGINDNGQVVGGASSVYEGDFNYAFLYSGGSMIVLGTLGGDYSCASGINDNGQVVGTAWTASEDYHAFLYSGGSMIDLGTLGESRSDAFGINNNGQVVGCVGDALGKNTRAFLCSGGVMTDLNSLIGTNSGWTLKSASSINDNGQIVGSGINPSGQTHAFLLTPLNPTNQITRLRVSQQQANVSASDSIDAPIVPKTDPNVLSTAADLGLGVVADEVTPVLFKFTGDVTNYTIEITHDATAYKNGALPDHLYVLQGGSWTRTANFSVSSFSDSGTAFAYLEGLRWTDFNGTPDNEVTVTVNVHPAGDSTIVASTDFLVRPPPVVLVHGYDANGSAWSPEFIAVLNTNRPTNFIRAVNYGTANDNLANRTWSFDDLLPELDKELTKEESNLHLYWAFTRYDVVGHSQGGVLLRMLCQNFQNRPCIVGPNNFYRGRFNRVITIGSPHNGSTLEHYAMDTLNSQNMRAVWPRLLVNKIQPKFDPFGSQIKKINNPIFPIDSRIKFHCIRTTVDSGLPPGPNAHTLVERFLGLYQTQTALGGKSPGQFFLARGYDSIVDYDSQGGGSGTPVTTMPNSVTNPANIAHVAVTLMAGIVDPFGVSSDHGQTTDTSVAGKVMDLLNGPASDFGPFKLPAPLPSVIEDLIDQVAPHPTIAGMIVGLPHPNIPSTNYYYGLETTTPLETNSPVTWFVQVFGTNGISSDGVSLLVNPNDFSQVTVSVTNGLQGTVVLYASYFTTNDDLVFANPLVVVSNPVGMTLSGIELDPASVVLSVGDKLPTYVWGDYTNGARSLLYIPSGQVQYMSSDTNIATLDSSGTITMNNFGAATIFANYSGFSAQAVITSTTPSISYFSGIGNTDKTFQLSFMGTIGTTNVIEASTNLINWVSIATLYNTNGFLQYLDFTATNFHMRFYRAMMP